MKDIHLMGNDNVTHSIKDIDRIIEMAWEDRTPFEAITYQFNIKEQDIIKVMCRELKRSSFKLWRTRVQGRKTKHKNKRDFKEVGRFKCTRQKHITHNKISKR